MVLFSVEIDEKIVNFVQHFLWAGVGPVDFVDDDDGLELGLKGLGQNIARLRQRALGRIDQQHHAIDHLERALHLAAEIGVAGGVHNIDFAAFKV